MRQIFVLLIFFLGACQSTWAGESARPGPPEQLSVKDRFEALCRLASEEPPSFSSDPAHYISGSPARQAMVALGPRSLPYVMERIRNDDTHKWAFVYVAAAILKIEPGAAVTGSSSRLQRHIEGKLVSGYQEAEEQFPRLNREWLKEKGQQETPELWRDIATLDAEFKVLQTRRELTPAGKAYSQIEGLGIFVLPSLMRELEKGNYDFLPIIGSLTDGKAPVRRGKAQQSARACIAWWAENKDQWTIDASELETPSSAEAVQLELRVDADKDSYLADQARSAGPPRARHHDTGPRRDGLGAHHLVAHPHPGR